VNHKNVALFFAREMSKQNSHTTKQALGSVRWMLYMVMSMAVWVPSLTNLWFYSQVRGATLPNNVSNVNTALDFSIIFLDYEVSKTRHCTKLLYISVFAEKKRQKRGKLDGGREEQKCECEWKLWYSKS